MNIAPYTIEDEKKFIDGLGTWHPKSKYIERRALLAKYLNAVWSRDNMCGMIKREVITYIRESMK